MKRLALALALTACGASPPVGAHETVDPTDGARHDVRATVDPYAAPVDVSGPPPSATRTQSGLASRVLRPGSGTAHPTTASTVLVHYTGWTTDGHMFDSSRSRGEPLSLPLTAVIAGWTEGVQLMVVGEERRFWMPASLAYGDHPRAGAPTGMLVFDIELLAIDP